MSQTSYLIFVSLILMVCLTLTICVTSKMYNKQLKFSPNDSSLQKYASYSVMHCSALCLSMQQSCFGFSYQDSICEIATNHLDDMQIDDGSGKYFFTDNGPNFDLNCLNGDYVNNTNDGEASCVCADEKNGTYYQGIKCDQECRFIAYPGKDLKENNILIEFDILDPKVCHQKCAPWVECTSITFNKSLQKCFYKDKSPVTHPELVLSDTDISNVYFVMECTQ